MDFGAATAELDQILEREGIDQNISHQSVSDAFAEAMFAVRMTKSAHPHIAEIVSVENALRAVFAQSANVFENADMTIRSILLAWQEEIAKQHTTGTKDGASYPSDGEARARRLDEELVRIWMVARPVDPMPRSEGEVLNAVEGLRDALTTARTERDVALGQRDEASRARAIAERVTARAGERARAMTREEIFAEIDRRSGADGQEDVSRPHLSAEQVLAALCFGGELDAERLSEAAVHATRLAWHRHAAELHAELHAVKLERDAIADRNRRAEELLTASTGIGDSWSTWVGEMRRTLTGSEPEPWTDAEAAGLREWLAAEQAAIRDGACIPDLHCSCGAARGGADGAGGVCGSYSLETSQAAKCPTCGATPVEGMCQECRR